MLNVCQSNYSTTKSPNGFEKCFCAGASLKKSFPLNPIKSAHSAPEYIFEFLWIEVAKILLQCPNGIVIGPRQETDWPVATEHAAIRPEYFQDYPFEESGTGASATSNFSALRAAQKSAGIGSVKSDRFSSNRSLVLTPGIFETTVG